MEGLVMMNYNTMTNDEIRSEMRRLGDMLELMNPCDNDWDVTYKKYFFLNSIMDERYREENQEQFDAFYEKNIKGKSWNEIDDETWGFYSDWHKDMFGYRPRSKERDW